MKTNKQHKHKLIDHYISGTGSRSLTAAPDAAQFDQKVSEMFQASLRSRLLGTSKSESAAATASAIVSYATAHPDEMGRQVTDALEKLLMTPGAETVRKKSMTSGAETVLAKRKKSMKPGAETVPVDVYV